MRTANRQSEQGNVIFIILIGVALFAALGFAISSGRDSVRGSGDMEEARLAASEVIQYGNTVSMALEKLLRIGGAAEINTGGTGVLFAASNAHADYGIAGGQPRTEVFHASGGSLSYVEPPPAACSAACNYEFTGQILVTDVGSNAKYELSMVLINIDTAVCEQMNRIWQNGFASIPTEDALTLTRFDGTNYGDTGGLNGITLGGTLAEKRGFCYQESSGGGRYIYVHVLRRR